MAKNANFFEEQREASEVKCRIVVKYFAFWAKFMAGRVSGNIAYIDLFCGPGRYAEDNTPSTPMLVMEEVIKAPKLHGKVASLFNDKNPKYTAALQANFDQLDGIKQLTYAPHIMTGEVDAALVAQFQKINLVPTFSFIDPFGYKGLTLELLDALLRSWGSDMVLFFSFNRINAAISNPKVKKHVDALFGGERAAELRELTSGKSSDEREAIVIDQFAQALIDKKSKYRYFVPYVFQDPDKDRTSHYIMFVSKDALGYRVMKEIMYRESTEFNQGVATFGHVRSFGSKTPLLTGLDRPLDELCNDLCNDYAGGRHQMKELYIDHQRNAPVNSLIKNNYKEALLKLESEGRITAEPAKRKPWKGRPTFGDDIYAIFPKRK